MLKYISIFMLPLIAALLVASESVAEETLDAVKVEPSGVIDGSSKKIMRDFPENSEDFKAMKERREQFKKELEGLSPEEKRQKFKELRSGKGHHQMQRRMSRIEKHDPEAAARIKKIKEQIKSLPEEDKEAKIQELREEFKSLRKKRHQGFEKRWDESSGGEKAAFCEKLKSKCSEGRRMACKITEKKCAK